MLENFCCQEASKILTEWKNVQNKEETKWIGLSQNFFNSFKQLFALKRENKTCSSCNEATESFAKLIKATEKEIAHGEELIQKQQKALSDIGELWETKKNELTILEQFKIFHDHQQIIRCIYGYQSYQNKLKLFLQKSN